MTVVQTGDVVDRGNASLPLLHRLWALQKEAANAGGEFVMLMGNHELLNMQGSTRYVHRGELADNGGADAWTRLMHPTHGEIGQRLSATPGVAIRGEGPCSTLFLHAGLRKSTAERYSTIDALNSALSRQARARSGELLDPTDGPLWWRGYARPRAAGLSELNSCDEAREALEALKHGEGHAAPKRMTVGHNIVPFISTRCEGAVHMIDVGMSSAYQGRPAAWRCDLDETGEHAQVKALYLGGEEQPPDLCTACAEVLGNIRSSTPPLRGTDPHGDCHNYCYDRPASLRGGGGSGGGSGSFWSILSAGAMPGAKVEF